MIATVGNIGFLHSIGYLAGWVVALFVAGEPMKRLGKYTFTDAGGTPATAHYPVDTSGDLILRPGLKYKLENSTPREAFKVCVMERRERTISGFPIPTHT